EKLGERTGISWTVAVLVGIAQVVAGVFPGTSRSAATIFVALLAGTTNRAAATEFAFLVGIPTMFAATGYEVLSLYLDGGLGSVDWAELSVAFVASAVTAFVAVKWLLHYIQSHRFTAFAVYRLALGAALLLWLPAGGRGLTPSARPVRLHDIPRRFHGDPPDEHPSHDHHPRLVAATRARRLRRGGPHAVDRTDRADAAGKQRHRWPRSGQPDARRPEVASGSRDR